MAIGDCRNAKELAHLLIYDKILPLLDYVVKTLALVVAFPEIKDFEIIVFLIADHIAPAKIPDTWIFKLIPRKLQ